MADPAPAATLRSSGEAFLASGSTGTVEAGVWRDGLGDPLTLLVEARAPPRLLVFGATDLAVAMGADGRVPRNPPHARRCPSLGYRWSKAVFNRDPNGRGAHSPPDAQLPPSEARSRPTRANPSPPMNP